MNMQPSSSKESVNATRSVSSNHQIDEAEYILDYYRISSTDRPRHSKELVHRYHSSPGEEQSSTPLLIDEDKKKPDILGKSEWYHSV